MQVLWSIEEAFASACPRCGSFPCGCGLDGPRFSPDMLLSEGYRRCNAAPSRPPAMCPGCRAELEYRGYRLLDQGDIVSYRIFALCSPCGRWIEV